MSIFLMRINDRGKIKLSMKRVDQETGEEIEIEIETEDRKKEANG